jgi:hypothetical protein
MRDKRTTSSITPSIPTQPRLPFDTLSHSFLVVLMLEYRPINLSKTFFRTIKLSQLDIILDRVRRIVKASSTEVHAFDLADAFSLFTCGDVDLQLIRLAQLMVQEETFACIPSTMPFRHPTRLSLFFNEPLSVRSCPLLPH